MKWLDDCRIRLMLLGFVVGLVLVGSGTAEADFTFGTPTNLARLAGGGTVWGAYISPDGLSLYFGSNRAGGYGERDIWVAMRETTDDNWGEPVNLGPIVNTAYSEYPTCISADGLSLYIGEHSNSRPGGYGSDDLWVATRETTDDDWGIPVNLGSMVNSAYAEVTCVISTDELSLFFQSNRPGTFGGCDIWVATRETTDDDWGEPVNLGPTVNSSSSSWDGPGGISTDGLALFFDSSRPGGYGGYDVWVATRPTTSDPWNTPVNLGPTINTSANDWFPSISRDGSALYFLRPGSGIWQAPIEPVIDLNGDGKVDGADMCVMVEHWLTDYPLCDIGPMPWGNGIVDVQDLIVLAEHLFEEILPFELVAYWRLDEEEGDIAYNSTSDNHGFLFGDPVWRPAEGKKTGTLEFDGIDDYVSTAFVLAPKHGPFSAFTWVEGGAPGQVVISQTGVAGKSWLCMDPSHGNLMTGLIPPPLGRSKPLPLESEAVITDDQWHHIGFVWDGLRRSLYVDGVEVAQDTSDLAPLEFSDGGLYIGAGETLDAGTFFSGLIDDVRIYNVALTPEEIEALVK
jgi:hypothetical protein